MLTQELIEHLKKPFAVAEHEFLRGFTYITESAILNRIEEVDPNWQFEVVAITHRANTITAHGRLIICGVVRDNTGMDVIRESNEAEKAAVTDALKRCARLFGVGRYLLDLGNVKDHIELANALGQPAPQPTAPQRAPQPAQRQTPPVPQLQGAQEEDEVCGVVEVQAKPNRKGVMFYKAGGVIIDDITMLESVIKVKVPTVEGVHIIPVVVCIKYNTDANGYKHAVSIRKDDTQF